MMNASPGSRIARFRSRLLERLRRGTHRTGPLVGVARLGAFLRRLLGTGSNRLGRFAGDARYRNTVDARPMVRRRRRWENAPFTLRLGLAPLRLTLVSHPTAGLAGKSSEAAAYRRESGTILTPSRRTRSATTFLASQLPSAAGSWARVALRTAGDARVDWTREVRKIAVSGGARGPAPGTAFPSFRLAPPRRPASSAQGWSGRAPVAPTRRNGRFVPVRFSSPDPRGLSGTRVPPVTLHSVASNHRAAQVTGYRLRGSTHARDVMPSRAGLIHLVHRPPLAREHQNTTTPARNQSPRLTIEPPRPVLLPRPFHPHRNAATAAVAAVAPVRAQAPLPLPLAAAPRKGPVEPGTEWIRHTRREVTETVLREVQTTVEREVVRRLQPHSEEFRRLGEALCSDLGSRMAFERERLGFA